MLHEDLGSLEHGGGGAALGGRVVERPVAEDGVRIVQGDRVHGRSDRGAGGRQRPAASLKNINLFLSKRLFSFFQVCQMTKHFPPLPLVCPPCNARETSKEDKSNRHQSCNSHVDSSVVHLALNPL
jgi:hypothetical protein